MTQKKKIMVVEDNCINRELLSEILSEQYAVIEAENGLQALELLKQDKDEVALILLDVMMPVMDGFTFLDKMKADEELAPIPVIIMTQSDSEDDEVAALARGATDFVPKPYRPQVILHRVASIIKLRETAALVNRYRYDRLTGLYSMEYFCQRVAECLQEDPEGEYSIIGSNIENFKVYNDTFGMEAGDRLLKEMADIGSTMVGQDGFCGRMSADRFLFFQKSDSEKRDRMKCHNTDHQEISPLLKNVVMRWGVYEITDRSLSVERMCDRAFLAADSIKGKYDQYVAVYDDTLRDRLLREKAITDAMEAALLQEQFTVYLQPKYSLNGDRLAGAEALVRWLHPQMGFMSPGEFIPIFEKNGFITQLDRYVWERVCGILRDWKEKGYPPLPVSVNVSRADVFKEDLAEVLPGLVREYGIEPAQLHLELTESAYANNPEQIISTVDRLRKLGFIVEMDDFGSGYSSLNMLNIMKLDILKLDIKFIQTETAKPAERGILQFIVSLARRLNLSVVAEGVETRAQLERLREVGCDYVQGYFFAKPMPVDEFEKLLEEQLSNIEEPTGVLRKENCVQSLLVVDSDRLYRENVRRTFEEQYRVLEAADAESGVACLREHGPNVIAAVILSTDLPDNGAQKLLNALRQDPVMWRIPVLSVLPGGSVTEDMVIHLDTDDFLCKCHPLCDLHRRVDRLLSLANYRVREQVLQDEACRDFLTGLLNRRGLYSALEALRQEDMPLAVYIFDLDNLKQVNDRNGHDVGDAMLHAFGELLRRHVRSDDILCRYGGDEFMVILRRAGSAEKVLAKGNDICSDFNSYLLPDGTRGSCSGGVIICGGDERPTAELLERADKAMYRAKRERKGGCVLWAEQ